MVEASGAPTFAEIRRNAADNYISSIFSSVSDLGQLYLRRAKQLPNCGIVVLEGRAHSKNMEHSLGDASLGARKSLAFAIEKHAGLTGILSHDVWFKPSDRAKDDEVGVIRTSTDRLVYTSLSNPIQNVDEHLSQLLGFYFIIACGTMSVDPAKATDAHLADFISTASLIAVPAHDGDTFLVFEQPIPDGQKLQTGVNN